MSQNPAISAGRKLRIAVLNRTFSPTGGGAERYSIALVEHLSAAHEIHVFAQQINHQWPGVFYHPVSAPLRKPRWVNQLWFAVATWLATRKGFDVVHSHENTWHGEVQTVHVLPVKHNLFHGRTGWRRVLRWAKVLTSPRLLTYLGLERLRYAARPGRQVVVTSESLQAIMASSYPASKAMTSVITPGITLPVWHSTPATTQKCEARAKLGLPASDFCLLFVGNDYRKKGLQTLLTAMSQLPVNVILAVVGNAAHIPLFRKQAELLKVGYRVFFLGSLDEVKTAYEAADCLVHPTLEDTFAMVVLEAMAYGLPVVLSGPTFCGIAGLLKHAVNAMILDDPRNSNSVQKAIKQIIEQPALQRQLVQGSHDFASRYEWREIAKKQEVLYHSVARHHAAAAA